jgi:glycosyltransferase involved in cell wall biosynthesis
MRIDLVFPAFPPSFDGIGDYTYHLASALSEDHQVRVLTAESAPTPCPGARVVTGFSLDSIRKIRLLEESIPQDLPDWVVVQYNPFSYGQWGFNPYLISTLRTLKARHPQLKVAVMVHEPFVPVESWQFAVMWTWQRTQFCQLGKLADTLFFPIQAWADIFTSWFPNASVNVLPVGSNIPNVRADRSTVRADLDLSNRLVLGLFGNAHPSRQLPTVDLALNRLRTDGHSPVLLYIGNAGDQVRDALSGHEMYDAGPLSAPDVSRHFAAMDLYLVPFTKGVSARRGSFLTGIQHGIATISTYGIHTDPMLRESADTGVFLAPDDDPSLFANHVELLARVDHRRAQQATKGANFFSRHFTWPHIANQMVDTLDVSRPTLPSPVTY